MNDKPNQEAPDWPPRSSAAAVPNGERRYGSTGQLFEAKSGRWERIPGADRVLKIDEER